MSASRDLNHEVQEPLGVLSRPSASLEQTASAAFATAAQPEVLAAIDGQSFGAQHALSATYEQQRARLLEGEQTSSLLNLPTERSRRVLEVVGERSEHVVRSLVREGKHFKFCEAQDTALEFEVSLPPPAPGKLERNTLDGPEQSDLLLQTLLPPQQLQLRLMNLENAAAQHSAERGGHALHLAIGCLHWLDPVDGTSRTAPLLLVPVTLSRSEVSERYQLQPAGPGVQENPALRHYLKQRLGVELPSLVPTDPLEVQHYFEQVLACVQQASVTQSFSLSADRIALGQFDLGAQQLHEFLDARKWPEDQKPWQHPMVRALLDPALAESVENSSQRSPHPEATSPLVLAAESGERRILRAVQSGQHLCVSEEPGVEKADLVVNALAQAVAEGKKVLLLSPKPEFLRAVGSTLEAVGLADLALRIDSESTPASVARELRRVLELGPPEAHETAELEQRRALLAQRLDAHAEVMKSAGAISGTSIYQAAAYLLVHGGVAAEEGGFPEGSLRDWDSGRYQAGMVVARKLEEFWRQHGAPEDHPWYGTTQVPGESLPHEEFTQRVSDAHELLLTTKHTLARVLPSLGLDPNCSERQHTQTLKALSVIDRLESDGGSLVSGIDLTDTRWDTRRHKIAQDIVEQVRYVEFAQRVGAHVSLNRLSELELKPIVAAFEAHARKGALRRLIDTDYSSACEELGAVAALPKEFERRAKFLGQLRLLQELQQQAESSKNTLGRLLGSAKLFQGEGASAEDALVLWRRRAQVAWATFEFIDAIKEHPEAKRLSSLWHKPQAVQQQSVLIEQASSLLAQYRSARDGLQSLLQYSPADAERLYRNASLTEQEQRLAKLRHSEQSAASWGQLLSLQREAREQNVEEVFNVASLSTAKGSTGAAPPAIAAGLARAWHQKALQEGLAVWPTLDRFQGRDQERIQADFMKAEGELQALNSQKILRSHWEGQPRFQTGGAAQLLQTETRKVAGHLALTKLTANAGRAVQQVKPILMMSPQSLAQNVAPGSTDFDLLVIDQGSQISPLEAMGAIAHSGQVLVFGEHPPHAPSPAPEVAPSSHGSLDLAVLTHPKSIFAALRQLNVPEQRLTRRLTGELTGSGDLSAQESWGGRAATVPAPTTEQGAQCLSLQFVSAGVYDRAKRVNAAEASAVAHAVLQHAQQRAQDSLGVVTISSAQAEAIFVELERLRRAHPETETFFRKKPESFFVKTLASAERETRDRIMLSIGHGRDAEGVLSLQLGPLIQGDGLRRLAHLMTRYRQSFDVYSSIRADEPELLHSRAAGVQQLASLLKIAEHPQAAASLHARAAPDWFQVHLQQLLEKWGYRVSANVGSSSCAVDLAIVDPKNPRRFILGLQTDGANYQSQKDASDREAVLPQALQARGWRLERVWLLDWLRDPRGEERRLKRVVEDAVQAESVRSTGETSSRSVFRAALSQNDLALALPYEKAAPRKLQARGAALTPSVATLSEALAEVVRIEAPVHRDEVAQRLCENMPQARIDASMRVRLVEAEQLALREGRVQLRGEYLYPQQAQFLVRPRSRAEERGSLARFDRVAPDEIEAAICAVLRHAHGIAPEELPPSVLRTLGFSPKAARGKSPEGVLAIDAALDRLRGERVIYEQGGKLFLSAASEH